MENRFNKLLEAQKEIGAIKKDSDNPFFHSKYFDINAILREVKPILNKHGLILTQHLMIVGEKNGLKTAITNAETGEMIVESDVFLPEIADSQKMGSAITYFRRYALQTLLALEAEDDDGNSVSGATIDYSTNKKTESKFMSNIIPTQSEVKNATEKLESATTIKELQTVWKELPPMLQDRLDSVKNKMKLKFNESKNG